MTRTPYARTVLVVVAAQAAVLVAIASRYGPHRDELYFVSAGQRLAWGYPDQPSLVPALARISTEIAPHNLLMLRLWSLLAMVAVVLLAAEFARLLGGGRAAQVLTAAWVASGVVIMAFGHWLTTATFDTLAWTAILVLATHALRATTWQRAAAYWLGVGIVAGIGLEAKHSVAFLLGALLVAILVVPTTRRALATPWPWLAGLTALVLWLPNLLWQAQHDWPVLALSADIRDEYGGLGGRIGYVGEALVMTSLAITIVWIVGLIGLIRRREWGFARPAAVAFCLVAAFFLVAGGKSYYLTGALPPLIAAGAVVLADHWSLRTTWLAGAGVVAFTLVGWPIYLPVLPVHTFASSVYADVGEDQLETIGWPEYAAQVRAVASGLSADQRRTAVVFTQNYGEAGALEWYGSALPVYSGHNGWRFWGTPRDDAGPVVVVGLDHAQRLFHDCRLAATLHNREHVDNEESGKHVYVCTGPAVAWSKLWHYSA